MAIRETQLLIRRQMIAVLAPAGDNRIHHRMPHRIN